MTADSNRLPPEATDTGDAIVLRPDRGTRIWSAIGAIVAGAVGVLLIASNEGAVVLLAGVAALLAGVYLLLVQAQRLEFDAASVQRRSLIRPGSVAWSEVTEAKVQKRYKRAPIAGAARQVGGLTLSMGPGSRRGRGPSRDEPYVDLSLEHEGSGPRFRMELNQADIEQAEALLATLGDRGWLPDDVTVSIDADEDRRPH